MYSNTLFDVHERGRIMPLLVFGLLVGVYALSVGAFYAWFGLTAAFIAAALGVVGFVIASLSPPLNDALRGNTPKTTRKANKRAGHTSSEVIAAETSDPDDDVVDFSTYPTAPDTHHH